jgi:hypothetical protein
MILAIYQYNGNQIKEFWLFVKMCYNILR